MLEINITKNLHGSKGDMQLFVNTLVNQGDFIVLIGESGAGKTTLLRVLAGLEDASGDISIDGITWLNKHKALPPQERNIGFVFQDYALFDNMTVAQNLHFVNEDKTLAKELLAMTELTDFAQRNVQALSGGQKQRVSLCRAMMKRPKLLLMDEPLSALDSQMRSKLQKEIKLLHARFGTTTIMVSHDVSEVYALADKVWKMDQGKIIQEGRVNEVFLQSNNSYKVEILKLHDNKAIVYVEGKRVEVEVNKSIKVGQMVEIQLKGIVV